MRIWRIVVLLIALAVATGGCGNADSATEGDDNDDTMLVIVDNDGAFDDIKAILYLLEQPDVEILALTMSGTGIAHCPADLADAGKTGLIILFGARINGIGRNPHGIALSQPSQDGLVHADMGFHPAGDPGINLIIGLDFLKGRLVVKAAEFELVQRLDICLLWSNPIFSFRPYPLFSKAAGRKRPR